MNRTDAAAILNLDPSASAEEARRAYQELFTEHQVRLTNAPTPALRSLYQARLLELDEAKDAFLVPSAGDADSDLPTDQPSIPSHIPPAAAPPAVPLNQPPQRPPGGVAEQQRKPEAAAEPPPAPIVRPVSAPRKKTSMGAITAIGIGIGVAGFVAMKAMGGRSGDAPREKATPVAIVSYADSLPPIRENITVARVEFGRGDYDAANSALKDADRRYGALPPAAASDTAVIRLKEQLDQLHSKVARACEALKKVAERHPGEPTCKSI